MTVSHLGSLSVGAVVPGAASAVDAALPDLQARIDALSSFAPTAPSLASQLALAQGIVTSIQSAITLGIEPPSINDQIAEIAAQLAIVKGQLAAAIGFQGVLAEGGVHLYKYAGQAGDLGSEFQAELSGGLPGGAASDGVNGLLVVTSVPAAWTAIEQVFKTS